MKSTRFSTLLVFSLAFALGNAATTSAQSESLTLQLTPHNQAPRGGDSYIADGYNVGCQATVWFEGEYSPWLWVYNWLYVDFDDVDYSQDFGYWWVSASTYWYLQFTPYTQHVACYLDSIAGQDSVSVDVPGVPSGETTQSGGWDVAGIHSWYQTRAPANGNYPNRWVWEEDGGAGTGDSCWWPNSIYLPADRVTGGRWPVDGSNGWGPDQVGWGSVTVLFYREQGRAPCGTGFYQNMLIDIVFDVFGDETQYAVNYLAAGFTDESVWSYRNGQYAERTWPGQPAPAAVSRPRADGVADRPRRADGRRWE